MQQTTDDLVMHLREQMLFLRNSAAAYDSGQLPEAKRIATTLRVLLHQSWTSKALLEQLGIRDKLGYRDHAEPVSPSCVFYSSLKVGLSAFGDAWTPNLERPASAVPFTDYWGRTVFIDGDLSITRSDLIRSVADQDGGAHVDPTLKAGYVELSRQQRWRFFRDGIEFSPPTKPHLPLLRQFAAELMWTVAEQAPALLGVDSI